MEDRANGNSLKETVEMKRDTERAASSRDSQDCSGLSSAVILLHISKIGSGHDG